MKDFLAIIRKLDFVDLFKYGQFTISYAVPFDGNIASHRNDYELFNNLTSRMNMYEYSFEYLIIHFMAECYNGKYIIDIKNVCNLYTFDEEAKREMSISFDSRIQLHVSPWADKFEQLQQKLSIKQSIRGVNNLWTIFDLPDSDLTKCETIIPKDVVQEVFRELYAYERPSGEQSIWTYLLRYERHSFYPKDMVGFFCDFVHVFCNYSMKQELGEEVAETTELYDLFTACQNPQFVTLLQIVESSPLYQKTEQASGCRFAIVAPLFLYLKDKFADGMEHKPNDKIISYAKEIGGFECSIAVYLLGLSLGHDKTYDAFYESAELSFFKKQIVTESSTLIGGMENATSRFPETSEESSHSNTSNMEKNVEKSLDGIKQKNNQIVETITEDKPIKNKAPKQKDLFSVSNSNSETLSKPIAWMNKAGKRGKKTKDDVCPVFSEEELIKFKNEGFKPVTNFCKTIKNVIESRGYDPEYEEKRLTKK